MKKCYTFSQIKKLLEILNMDAQTAAKKTGLRDKTVYRYLSEAQRGPSSRSGPDGRADVKECRKLAVLEEMVYKNTIGCFKAFSLQAQHSIYSQLDLLSSELIVTQLHQLVMNELHNEGA